jgi:hypothetical protein
VPEPGMGHAYLGLFFMEVLFFTISNYRGINDGWHGTTPCRTR